MIIINGVVSIGKPTIKVTKLSDGTVYREGETPELDPREKINVNVTIPNSQVTTNFSAIYKYSSNGLQYGWKLDKDGTITTGGTGTNCKIDITADDAVDTLNIKNANGNTLPSWMYINLNSTGDNNTVGSNVPHLTWHGNSKKDNHGGRPVH